MLALLVWCYLAAEQARYGLSYLSPMQFRALVALDDGFRQDLLRLGELQIALVGLFRRATQELYPFVNIRVGGYELAGEPGWLPAGLSGERDPGESGRKGEHGNARDGTHGG